jgi:hypothetical protein
VKRGELNTYKELVYRIKSPQRNPYKGLARVADELKLLIKRVEDMKDTVEAYSERALQLLSDNYGTDC